MAPIVENLTPVGFTCREMPKGERKPLAFEYARNLPPLSVEAALSVYSSYGAAHGCDLELGFFAYIRS